MQNSPGYTGSVKEHDDLWCYKCEEEDPNCTGWEYQFSNIPAIKAHMHNDNGITIFEEININDHGGFRRFLQPAEEDLYLYLI